MPNEFSDLNEYFETFARAIAGQCHISASDFLILDLANVLLGVNDNVQRKKFATSRQFMNYFIFKIIVNSSNFLNISPICGISLFFFIICLFAKFCSPSNNGFRYEETKCNN